MLQRQWRSALLLCLLVRMGRAQEPWQVSLHNNKHHDPARGESSSSSSRAVGATVLDALYKLQETLSTALQNSQPPRKTRPKRKRAATRRRALYEHTLHSHYNNEYYTVNDESFSLFTTTTNHHEHHLHYPSDDSSWGHTPCIFYNELKASYWTYQWCFSQQVAQAHWIPSREGQFKADFVNQLGTYVTTTKTPPEWALSYHSTHDDAWVEYEYFRHGDECQLESQEIVRRKTLVIKNPKSQCGGSTTPHAEWRIVAVTEPTPCTYVLYACGPHEPQQDTATTATTTTSTSDASRKPPPITTTTTTTPPDLPVLEAYLHEAQVVGSTSAIDRTTSWHTALPPLPPSRIAQNRKLVQGMFQHAYDSYIYHAYPASEIQPLTCTPGSFDLVKLPALSLMDALDTLLVMGNTTEFARSVERLRLVFSPDKFAVNQNVSVFETNIRVLGGLLSAHQMATAYISSTDVLAEQVWDEDGNVRHGRMSVKKDREELQCPSRDNDNKNNLQQYMCTASLSAAIASDQCTAGASLLSTLDLQEPVCIDPAVCLADSKQTNATEDHKTCALQYWTYDGLLLELAHDLGTRLLPAFDTKTGIPYGTVNLVHGIPHGETTVASLAGGGTLSLEMELLSRLTGDESFGKAAKLAARALWLRRSKEHLLGKHIEINNGGWTESLSGIGSNSDSYYEYLMKHYVLFPEDADFWTMFVTTYNGVYNGTRTGEWYADVDMNLGTRHGGSRKVFESLQAFYPGMQVLVGELGPAARSLNSFFLVREFLGFLPERFNYGTWKVDGGPHGAGVHPLRPELLESCYFLHQATKAGGNGTQSSGWLWAADFALHTLNELTDATCGFATVKDLSPTTTGAIPAEDSEGIKLVNDMPSFFLSETLKYLYLIFDDDNMLHHDDEREWIFTTEAHPFHYVPKKKAQSKDKTSAEQVRDSRKQKVAKLLHMRLAGTNKNEQKRWMSQPSMTSGLVLEKWAGNTQLASHMSGLRESESGTLTEKQDPPLFRQFLVPEESQEINLAYLSFGDIGMGDGSSLGKSCHNFHRSSIQWIRALNGGVLDYSEVFVSSMTDDLYSEGKPEALSAAEALSYHGSGLYLGQFSDPEACSVRESTDTETAVSPEKTPQDAVSQRFDMGGKHGEFEITALSEGFMIKHLKSGELIVTTVLVEDGTSASEEEEEESTKVNPFVMVYSQKPLEKSESPAVPKQWKLGANWRSLFGRNKKQVPQREEFERSIAFTDSNNHAFRCEIELIFSHEGMEEQLAVYPCAPALFGPTRLSQLAQTGELDVGGYIFSPDPSDEMGCSESDYQLPRTVQMVRRGVCTFHGKAVNQKARSGAEAVIVVNSDDDLFLMSNDGIDQDTPVSVLVTKQDGEEMMAAIKEGIANNARVRLSAQEGSINAKGEVTGPVDWPMVRTSSDLVVQVFAESGWGVHGMSQPMANGDGEDGRQWQLVLMNHNGSQ